MNLDLVNTLEMMKKYLNIPSPGGYTLHGYFRSYGKGNST